MKPGEIWNKNNGVGLLDMAEGTNSTTMQVVIEPQAADNVDEIDVLDEYLGTTYKHTVKICDDGALKCAEKPVFDGSDIPGWSCDVTKYGARDGCDCDCGIWDPDCDDGVRYSYGIVQNTTAKDIKLLDSTRIVTMLKRFDNSPFDHKISSNEMQTIRAEFAANHPLRKLAEEIFTADGRYIPLLKMAPAKTCPTGKVCLRHPKRTITTVPGKTGLAGVCTSMDSKTTGAGCDEMPCGTCATSTCLPSTINSWGYKCAPLLNGSVTIKAKSDDSYLENYKTKMGSGRRSKWVNQIKVDAGHFGSSTFVPTARGWCAANEVLATTGVKPRKRVTRTECEQLAVKLGGKAYTWRTSYHRKVGQECNVYKDYCKNSLKGSGHTKIQSYSLQEVTQKWFLRGTEDPTMFKIESSVGGCLFTAATFLVGIGNCLADNAQTWEVSRDCQGTSVIMHPAGQCLTFSAPGAMPKLNQCSEQDTAQKWEINGIGA